MLRLPTTNPSDLSIMFHLRKVMRLCDITHSIAIETKKDFSLGRGRKSTPSYALPAIASHRQQETFPQPDYWAVQC